MRPRKIFFFYTSHTDPGWHDLPERVMAQHARFLDAVIEYCEQTRELPVEQRFVFSSESTWTIDYFERHRSRAQFERLMECCRSGQLEITALYAGVHTDLCGHEELARLCWYATDLRRRFSVPVSTAMLNDVSEGYTKGFPQLLARSGINSIVFGPGVKAIAKGIRPNLPRLFRWQTPDGSSVLVGWTPGFWTYIRNTDAGFYGSETLDEFEALGASYPYDAIFRHMGDGDNSPPRLEVFQYLQEYREQVPGLPMRLARTDEFFTYIREHFADRIPVFQGDNPQPWADGTLSLAHETALHRIAQRTAISAEIYTSLAAALAQSESYPHAAFQDIYRNLHLYSDHTWGLDLESGLGEGSRLARATGMGVYEEVEGVQVEELDVSSPAFDEWRKNWDAKKIYAQEASQSAEQLQHAALQALSNSIAITAPSIVVWNSASWQRGELVRVRLNVDTSTPFALIDPRTNRELAWQLELAEDGGTVLVFYAPDLPPLGYACYCIEQRATQVPHGRAVVSQDRRIENALYRVELDPEQGTITSIWDKKRQRELVDQHARYGFNQYIHADVTEGYEGVGNRAKSGMAHGEGKRYLPDLIEQVACVRGPVYSSLSVRARLTRGHAPATVTRTVVLPAQGKWIDIVNDVDKKAALAKEQVYFAFPFALEQPFETHIELPYAVMNWERDILPSCWRGYSSALHWVDLSNEAGGITWSALDAPVLCVGDITSNEWDPQWHASYIPRQGHLYSYIMSNIWNCNYALWQGGQTRFRYRLASHAGPCQKEQAARFGWGNAAPLQALQLPPQQGTLPAPQFSALSVSADNVLITALKRADDEQGWIVRLYETAGQPRTDCTLSINFVQPRSVYENTLAEEQLQEIALDAHTVNLHFNAHELKTIRIL